MGEPWHIEMAPANPNQPQLSDALIGVLGGSGLYGMEGLSDVEELQKESLCTNPLFLFPAF